MKYKKDKDGNFIGMKNGIAIAAKYWFRGECWIAVWINNSVWKMYKDAISLHSDIINLMDIGYMIEWY